MTAVVPVLLRTTLSQRAMPATLLFNPVDCCIYDGRTICSFQGAEGSAIYPSIYQPPTQVLKPTNIFVKSWKSSKIYVSPRIMCIRFSYFAHWTPCPAPLAHALFLTVLCRLFRCRGPKKFVNNLLQSTSPLCFHARSLVISPEKRKSTAQNRTRTMNCPNSVSYGAWKFFSPYGSCSACAIRNR